MNDYNQQRYNRKKNFSRLYLGIQQLINYPVINCVWLIIVVVIIALHYGEGKLLEINYSSETLINIMDIVIEIVNIIVPVILALGITDFIGEMTARKDEADMCLVFGKQKGLINQPPILIRKKYDKRRKITTREFYTSIPLEMWQKNKDAICDRINVTLIGDITYGGKRKNKGNQILFTAKKGRKILERGRLYDDTF